MMDEALSDLDWTSGQGYIDDIACGSNTFEDHCKDLQKLFDRLTEWELSAKLSKCLFFKKRMEYLGHEISYEGIRPNQSKIETITKMKPPIDISGVRRFLGITSYYRKFIRNYARVAEPLYLHTKKNVLLKWNDESQQVFEELKHRLTEAPVLRYPDYTKPFSIETDASDFAIGAILSQKDEKGREYAVVFASRTLNAAERRYSATERECLAVVWAVDQFQIHLGLQPFIVHTDHNPLKWLLEKTELKGKYARWALKLQEFDMEVKYRPGIKNGNTDTLSRIDEDHRIRRIVTGRPSDNQLFYLKKKERIPIRVRWIEEDRELLDEQRSDKDCGEIIDYLERKILPTKHEEATRVITEAATFEVINGLLYKKITTSKNFNESQLRLAIPESMKKQVLQAHHNSITAGHLGINKTYGKLLTHYWWDGMWTTTKKWIRQCPECCMRKGNPQKHLGLPLSTVSERPWHILGADILGPLTSTTLGNRYVLVVTDHFTKWVEAFALPNQTAETIATKLVEEVFARYGMPENILTDRGRNFIGELLTWLEQKLDIRQLRTSSLHPQTNAIPERFNRTIVTMLSYYVSERQDDWDVFLPGALLAYRTAIHPSTGYSPFFLMFGREAREPLQLKELDEMNDDDVPTSAAYAQTLAERLHIAYQRARITEDKKRQERENYLLKKRVDHPFKIDNYVLLHLPLKKKGRTHKLAHPSKGPYRIAKFVTPVTVILEGKYLRKLREPVHVSRLKFYHGVVEIIKKE